MKAMILAAGRGTRLASVNPGLPKALVEISGRPLLERQLEYLAANGITEVVVNAHHLAEAVQAFARDYGGPARVTVVTEPELLGTAGGVRNALDHLGDEPFFVLYGDVVVDEALPHVMEAHRDSGATITITVYETAEIEGKGTVEVDPAGRVTGFAEKAAASLESGTALVNAGIYVVEPSVMRELDAGVELDFGHDVFPDLLARDEHLATFRLARPVVDVGTPAGLEQARREATL